MQCPAFLKFTQSLWFVGFVILTCAHVSAATTNVTYGSFFFNPKIVVIQPGDTVFWTNGLGSHNALGTSGDMVCGPTMFLPCSHTFNVPGNFTYQCNVAGHDAFGMTGLVIVARPPPTRALLTNVTRLTNGQFRFSIVSAANQTNILQASTNLASGTNWILLSTIVSNSSAVIFTDSNAAAFPERFYRVISP